MSTPTSLSPFPSPIMLAWTPPIVPGSPDGSTSLPSFPATSPTPNPAQYLSHHNPPVFKFASIAYPCSAQSPSTSLFSTSSPTPLKLAAILKFQLHVSSISQPSKTPFPHPLSPDTPTHHLYPNPPH
ncbi:hypothetical protein BDP27DRAFT_1430105 [Rhodocollybia butyracea]|uniref:Uncharacterized protein n=1 Tax=Rhodocollybia butyracea TaxID=206335 RepID=A0A9P5PC40_9AGAR|nr:hypothetical protein BDP27DRAFT_1430105 [Rhodocollybia butyracea]